MAEFSYRGVSATESSITWEITFPSKTEVYQVHVELLDQQRTTSNTRYLRSLSWQQQGEESMTFTTGNLSYNTRYAVIIYLVSHNGVAVQVRSSTSALVSYTTANVVKPSEAPTDLVVRKIGSGIQIGWTPGKHNHWYRVSRISSAGTKVSEQWRSSGNLLVPTSFIYTSTDFNWTVGDTYTILLETQNDARVDGGTASVTYTHVDEDPAPIDYILAIPRSVRGSVDLWTRSVGSTDFKFEYYNAIDDTLITESSWNVGSPGGTYRRSQTGLPQGEPIYVLVYGISPSGRTATRRHDFMLPDMTAPTITNLGNTTVGVLYMKWEATAKYGISHFDIMVGTEGGATSTLVKIDTVGPDVNEYTWKLDAEGKKFVVGSTYRIRVVVYDKVLGTSATRTATLVFETGWEWYTPKNKGEEVLLTAIEWNHFCETINDMRLSKGHGTFPFTPAVTGEPMTAVQINQARVAINTMNPIAEEAIRGRDATADYLNMLRDSLNAI